MNSRKMSPLEQITVLGHDNFQGSCSVAACLTIKNILEFDFFIQAWHVLFKRHPLLRALPKVVDPDIYFDLSAEFKNIPIKLLKTDSSEQVDEEYSHTILKPFDRHNYFWRATLVIMPKNSCSHIIFAAPHTICDGTSISYLLADLLQIITELKEHKSPNTESYALPLAINELLDYRQFSAAPAVPIPLTPARKYENAATLENTRSHNILMQLEPKLLNQYLAACKHHKISLNAALNAALALSIRDISAEKMSAMNLFMVFDLRSRATEKISPRTLAFYAHQVMIFLEFATEQNFWHLAAQIKTKEQAAIKDYQPPIFTEENSAADIIQNWQSCLAKQEFLMPCAISNLGVIDAAYETVKLAYDIESFYFTVSQQAMPYSFVILAATIHGKLCLDFNFSVPALSKKTAEKIIDRIFFYMNSNCEQ